MSDAQHGATFKPLPPPFDRPIISSQDIRKRLKLTTNINIPKRREEERAEAVRLRNAGATLREIGKAMGVSYEWVRVAIESAPRPRIEVVYEEAIK